MSYENPIELERAVEIIVETINSDKSVIKNLIKGFVVGIVSMEMEGGKLNPNGRLILDDLYEKFPGLQEQIQRFARDP